MGARRGASRRRAARVAAEINQNPFFVGHFAPRITSRLEPALITEVVPLAIRCVRSDAGRVTSADLKQKFNPMVAEAIKAATLRGPYSSLLGLRVDEVSPGEIVCSLPLRPELHSGVGAVHGGAISSLIDHTLSLAVYPLMEPGMWAATAEFKVNYVDSVRQEQGALRARGTVLSLKTRTAVVRVDVDNGGKLVATALGTLYLRDKPK